MDREMRNLESRDVYYLVPRAPGMRALRLGWVLHRKFKNGTLEKNKARLVGRGNHQRPGIDYGLSFVPVMRLESLRTLLALGASHHDFDIIQFDVTSAYLHGNLKEKLYMEQPNGYAVRTREGELGLAAQEEAVWVGTGGQDLERGVEHLHGERRVHRDR